MTLCDNCQFVIVHRSRDKDIVEYECAHPDALEVWAIHNGEKCPRDLENDMSKVKLQGRRY